MRQKTVLYLSLCYDAYLIISHNGVLYVIQQTFSPPPPSPLCCSNMLRLPPIPMPLLLRRRQNAPMSSLLQSPSELSSSRIPLRRCEKSQFLLGTVHLMLFIFLFILKSQRFCILLLDEVFARSLTLLNTRYQFII